METILGKTKTVWLLNYIKMELHPKIMWFNHYQNKFSEKYLPKEFFIKPLDLNKSTTTLQESKNTESK